MFLKKAMAWILTAMLVFPLAACGSQPATLSGTEEESASSAGQETPDGSPADLHLYGLLREEWAAQQAGTMPAVR